MNKENIGTPEKLNNLKTVTKMEIRKKLQIKNFRLKMLN